MISSDVAAGDDATASQYNDLREDAARAAPVGSLAMWLTDSAPDGWLLCYGQAISRSTYSELFTVLGTTFGSGDGSTTFNLPDMRGRFPLGQDDMGGSSADRVTAAAADSIGGTGGEETHTLTDAEVPSQNIKFRGTGATSGANPVIGIVGTGNQFETQNVSSSPTDTYTYSTEGGGGAHSNMPPYFTLNYIIKT